MDKLRLVAPRLLLLLRLPELRPRDDWLVDFRLELARSYLDCGMGTPC